MHILIIPSWYPAHPADIGGSFFREQAIALRKRGHKVGIITPQMRSLKDWRNILNGFGIKKDFDEGVITYRFKTVNVTPRMDLLTRKHWLLAGLKLYSEYEKRNGRPDIVHVHSMYKGVFLAYALFKKFDIPYVVTEHSSAFAKGFVRSQKIDILRLPVQKAKKRMAVSRKFAHLLQNLFDGTEWLYLPNIVSDKFIEYPSSNDKNKDFWFVNVCFITENKRIDCLIRAFARLCNVYKNIRLRIGGDGPCRQELELLSEKLGVKDKVVFLGMLGRDQVAEQICHSDAFVLSSEFETFGVVLIEALALGKPVVATRCGGPESIVTEEVGCLVEKNDVDSLYEGMKKVYETEFDNKKIKEYCVENFSETAVTAKLELLYKEIIPGKL